MALPLLTFNTILERLQCTSSLPTDILQAPAGLHIGDIRFCSQIRTLCMQCMDLPYLKTLVTEDHFQPKGTKLDNAIPTTCILINFLSNAEYTDIKHMHVGLIVMCQGFLPSEQKDILPFLDYIRTNLKTTQEKEIGCGHKLPMLIPSACFWLTLPACWLSSQCRLTALSIPLSLPRTPPRMRGITVILIRSFLGCAPGSVCATRQYSMPT